MSGSTRSEAPAASAGFTLIEVVVALAVIAVMLTSIGALVGATVRGSHALDEHLALIETVRALEADTDRTALEARNDSRRNRAVCAGASMWRLSSMPPASRAPGSR